MAKRRFRLPGVEELNKDQDRVLRLPEDGQFLIVGGPGTGKSVVALLRAIKFNDNQDYVFLTYNKVLNLATKQMVGENLEINTLLTFFNQNLKLNCKLIKDELNQDNDKNKKQIQNCSNILSKNYGHDYKKIQNFLQTNSFETIETTQHLIIDEGQDMSSGYYDCLEKFGFQNFFIVSDQNQQITDENSSREDLTKFLDLKVKDVIELQQNYRNSHSIALVAQNFFTDIASPKPQLPQALNAQLGTPILYNYNDFNKCIKFILREADRDNSNLIGVVVAETKILNICKNKLENIEIDLDNKKPIIQNYLSKNGQDVNINFDEGGIVILNAASIKGLEFDIVFIIINGFKIYNNDLDSIRKRFYVMSSRAIKKLVFFKNAKNTTLDNILPSEDILQRKEL